MMKIVPLKEVKAILAAEKQTLLQQFPEPFRLFIDRHSYFAGGCVYSLVHAQEPKDYDLFFDDALLVESIKEMELPGVTFRSDNAITLLDKYQVVICDSGNPEDVVGRFDFMHNMFYFKDGVVSNVAQWRWLYSNNLKFNDTGRARDLCGVLMRIPKFVSRGMAITKREIAAILEKLDKNGGFTEQERKAYRHPYSTY